MRAIPADGIRQVIQKFVAGDRSHPEGEKLRPVIGVPARVDRNQDFLHQILRLHRTFAKASEPPFEIGRN